MPRILYVHVAMNHDDGDYVVEHRVVSSLLVNSLLICSASHRRIANNAQCSMFGTRCAAMPHSKYVHQFRFFFLHILLSH